MAPKSLSESAKSNPTALGDPVSLKAETSDNEPTKKSQTKSRTNLDTIAPSPTEGDLSSDDDQDSSKKSLKDIAKDDLNEAKKGNRSMLGDPVSLKAETTEKDPIEDDGRGQITGNKKRDSKL
jgi:hypothetical protein